MNTDECRAKKLILENADYVECIKHFTQRQFECAWMHFLSNGHTAQTPRRIADEFKVFLTSSKMIELGETVKDTGSTLEIEARLVVHKFDPKELVDLYVTAEEMRELCRLFGSNRVTVALRIRGIG